MKDGGIMIISSIPENLLDNEILNEVEREEGEKIRFFKNFDDVGDNIKDAEIIISAGYAGEEVIRKADKLKWFFSYSAGVDGLPFKVLEEKNVIVTNTSGIHKTQIAEQVLGVMISFSRRLKTAYEKQQERVWCTDLYHTADELMGKRLLIIGAGHIGKEIARKASAFDMKITGLKRTPGKIDYFDEVYGIDKLNDLLPGADYVVLITPLTDETYHLMGREQFKLMKSSAVFINVSRGDTADEDALTDALKTKNIRGAGLDVFHQEPLNRDSQLWYLDNVIITPHSSGFSPYNPRRAAEMFLENYKRYKKGEKLINTVSLKDMY